MIRYIIIDGENAQESQERCSLINRLLYLISVPPENTPSIDGRMFEEIRHPITEYQALTCVMNHEIPINNMGAVTILMNALVGKVPQAALDAQIMKLEQTNSNGAKPSDRYLPFSEVVPESEPLFTRDDMVVDGWLPEDEVY